MIRHTGCHRIRILLVALNHSVKLSQLRQDLGHPVPVGLTDASGRGYCLRKLLLKPVRTPVAILGSLGVCIYVPASRHWLISYSPIHLI